MPTAECFDNGLDTVKIVLYNAPYTKDSVQQLFVNAAGLTSATETFNLLPGALHTVALQDNAGNDIGDTITLRSPSGSKVIVCVGFDAYGNKIGSENGTWTATGSLHAITNNANVSRIYYDAANARSGEQGFISATAQDTVGGIHRDSVYVRILGPSPKLVSASTRDASGDGYLDEIVLVFSAKVTFPAAAGMTASFSGVTFSVDSVRGMHADSDSVFIAYLAEQITAEPQTAWRPLVSVHGVPNVNDVDSLTCADGAGPVVWSVVKSISSIGDRRQDLVTVEFSEPVHTAGGNALPLSLAPSKIFDAWVVTGNGDTVLVDGMLTGIPYLFKIVDASTIQFYMTNGNDLNDRNLLSLRADTPGVADATQWNNLPVPGNRRAPVKVETSQPNVLVIVPNPSMPTLHEEAAGVLNCSHNPLARSWVRQDQAGVVMTFKLMPPTDPTAPVKVRLFIYDNIGNPVQSAETSDIFPAAWRSGPTTVHDIDIYWNGTNKVKMSVAAGVYRVYLFVDSEQWHKKFIGTIGIR